MDQITRKNLKTDRLVEEVSHGVDFIAKHRQQFVRAGIVAAIALVAGLGFWYYQQTQKAARQSLLSKAYLVQDSPVGPPQGDIKPPYATEAERTVAAAKAFQAVIDKYPNSAEALVAKYFLAAQAATAARWNDAERGFQEVISRGNPDLASLARLSLAQVYAGQGKAAEAEKILRELADKPTATVSKEQAQITLARILMPSRPDEARKILEPMRTARSAVSRAAISALGEGGLPEQ
jgi:predicted negative regulator of RcsB-dependent stress response